MAGVALTWWKPVRWWRGFRWSCAGPDAITWGWWFLGSCPAGRWPPWGGAGAVRRSGTRWESFDAGGRFGVGRFFGPRVAGRPVVDGTERRVRRRTVATLPSTTMVVVCLPVLRSVWTVVW